jgi:hypothetical protein
VNARPQETGRITLSLPLRVAILAATAGAWVGWCILGLPGHALDASRFIINDPGSFLYAVDRLSAGEHLYSGFSWQYGPLGVAWYRLFAAVMGNSPLALMIASGVATAAAWGILASLWTRFLGFGLGWGLASAVLLPAMTPPCLFSIGDGPNAPIEATLFAAIAWVLCRGPGTRWQPWCAGLLVGLLQWTRFGPQAGAGLAILLVWCMAEGPSVFPSAWRMAVAYAALALPLAVWYLVALPLPGAVDQFWPSYMVKHYQATYGETGLKLLAASWGGPGALPSWLALGVGAAGLAAWIPRARERREWGSILFLPLYFGVGCLFLFRTHFAVQGHAWMGLAALPAALLVPGLVRFCGAGLGLIALAMNVKACVALGAQEREWKAQPLVLPNGQQLWFHGRESSDYAALQAFLKPARPGSPPPSVAVFYYGGGIHYFFGVGRVGRHWWFMPEFIRPWESGEVARDLARHSLFILWDPRVLNGNNTVEGLEDIARWLPVPEGIRASLVPRLGVAQLLPGVGYGVPNRDGR